MADDSKPTDVAARYAQALFDLARDKGALAAVESDLKSFKAMHAESADLRRLLASPAFGAEDKGRGLDAVAQKAGFGPVTRKFFGLMAANRRAAAVPAAPATGAAKVSADPNTVICRHDRTPLASHIPVKNCHTKAEWAAIDKANAANLEQFNRSLAAARGQQN